MMPEYTDCTHAHKHPWLENKFHKIDKIASTTHVDIVYRETEHSLYFEGVRKCYSLKSVL